MSSKLLAINIIFAVADTLIAALCICGFGWGAYHFGKWWMLCFSIIPLVLFNSHSAIVEADIEAAKEGSDSNS